MDKDGGTNATLEPHEIKIDLRQPGVAAVWAWLWPGAGHIYQGRYAKGILYMACILGTYFFGLGMGSGHVVYASFSKEDFRWHYVLQMGVGLPASPAIVQYLRQRNNMGPLFYDVMSPPVNVDPNNHDQLASWHEESHMFFELGTLYTVVAGLLNVLAIYDAYAGPVVAHAEDEDKPKPPPDDAPA